MNATTQDADLVGAAWAMPPESCPRFSVDTTPELRRYGVRGGRTVVVLTPGAVGLMGTEGGDRFIPFDRVAGLRAGILRGRRYRQPELRLHLKEPAETLLLFPLGDPPEVVATGRGYAGFVRGLAAELAARGRAGGVETGTSLGWAIIYAILFGSVTATMLAIFAWTLVSPLPEEERLIAPVVTGSIALGMLLADIWFWRSHWPLRVRRPSDLERMLHPI